MFTLPPSPTGSHRSSKAVTCLLLLTAACGSFGCHRSYYRNQADAEAYALIDEKVLHSCQTPNEPLRIELDRRSRMFNPFDPDRQPMPVDDPASHRYMAMVDGRRGYPLWHAAGQTNAAESPDWWQFLPLDENGVLVLDADTAVQLALLHSPDYQRQLEQLYLSALDVSSERFRFDTQFFGSTSAFLTADGPDRNVLGGNSSTLFNTNRDFQMRRTFATGADLVVGFANSIVWQLSGPDSRSATTVLDFSLIQPLLRGAGRDRVLERLTLSERRLLANVRAFERYRRSFYLNIVTGRNTESTVQRSGGVFGVGLGGFTGLGGGFAGLGGGGGGAGGGGGVAQAGGFIGLLQDQLQIQNLEENVARLNENVLLLEETLVELLTTIPDDAEAIPRQRLQVAQARQALLSAQTQLLTRQAGFQASVDTFLGDLGLPPYICVEIRDPLLQNFELIDTELRQRGEEVIELRTGTGESNLALLEFAEVTVDPATGLPTSRVVWTPELAEVVGQLRGRLAPLERLRDTLIEGDLPRVSQDLVDLEESIPRRRVQNERLEETYQREREQICTLLGTQTLSPEIFDFRRVEELLITLRRDYAALSSRLEAYDARITRLLQTLDRLSASTPPGDLDEQQLAQTLRDEIILAAQDLLAALSEDVLALQLIQARARTESVLLPEVDLTPAQALEIARVNRRDWANARAQLVDSWRLIEFNADDLESNLDLVFSGDIQNATNDPLDLRASTGRLRVGVQWDAPLTRLQERNTYRQSLIEFNQARRSYYQYEDGIWLLLRGQIRQLRTNQINFELGRQAVRIAAGQIALNEDIRQLGEARGLSSGPTAARDVVSALNDLLDAQNSLLNIWVNYEVVRRSLDFDLGTMELTPEGLWLDPGTITAARMGGNCVIAGPGMIVEADAVNLEPIPSDTTPEAIEPPPVGLNVDALETEIEPLPPVVPRITPPAPPRP